MNWHNLVVSETIREFIHLFILIDICRCAIIPYTDITVNSKTLRIYTQSSLLHIVPVVVFTVCLAQTEQDSLSIKSNPPCIGTAAGVI